MCKNLLELHLNQLIFILCYWIYVGTWRVIFTGHPESPLWAHLYILCPPSCASGPQLVGNSHVGEAGSSRSESHQGTALVLGPAEPKSAGPDPGAAGHGPPQGAAALPESGSGSDSNG